VFYSPELQADRAVIAEAGFFVCHGDTPWLGVASEDPEETQQGDDADDDDDDLDDLPDAGFDRQALDQVEDEHDHQEGDEDADKN
jgi:hypothetical protein